MIDSYKNLIIKITLLFFLLFSHSLHSQVVNTEKLRSEKTKKKFFMDGDFNFGLTSNKAGQSSRYGFRLRAEYYQNKQKFLLFTGGNQIRFLSRSSGSVHVNFVNNRFAHLRYNYTFQPRLTLEAFSQLQFDEIQLIRNRSLTGTGLRIKITESDTSSLFLGAIVMYEYEEEFVETDDPQPSEIDLINRDIRASTYVSAAYAFTSFFSIDHVTYYQPNLRNFQDFRVSSETVVTVNVSRKISFKTYFQLIYDSRPPDPAVPNTMYSLTTGLSFSI